MIRHNDNRTLHVSSMNISSRILSSLVGVFYSIFLIESYEYLSLQWGYLGFTYIPSDTKILILSISFAGVLGAALPQKDIDFIGYAKWVLYYILFIPCMIIPPYQGMLNEESLLFAIAAIFASGAAFFILVGAAKPFSVVKLSPRYFWSGLVGAWGVGHAMIIYVFGDSIALVGLDDVYAQRSTASSVGGAAIVYVLGGLSGAVNPFLVVVGVVQRRLPLLLMGLFGQLLVYATLAGKVVIGSTILTLLVPLLFRAGVLIRLRIWVVAIVVGAVGPLFCRASGLSNLAGTISDLVYMRILTLPGVLIGVYSDFFETYPLTYLSHSLIGKAFYDYPYGQESVGQVVGRYVSPTISANVNNYNANFIAADGIAGFWLIGIPVAVALAALWFWVLGKLVGRDHPVIACGALMPFIMSLADASLFTALLTGGGAASGLILYLYRSAQADDAGNDTAPFDSKR